MVLYYYNYPRVILDAIMNINIGHHSNSNNAFTLHDVGLEWYLYLAEFVQI